MSGLNTGSHNISGCNSRFMYWNCQLHVFGLPLAEVTFYPF
uniref:Uncharacterized protein n=1 Tax=Rhizophora mucronata TaxID=61149 RepID=A0A2P2P0A6_RHIMU